ncbi:hypothetical protein ACJX0J_028056, partial [Zea mays]
MELYATGRSSIQVHVHKRIISGLFLISLVKFELVTTLMRWSGQTRGLETLTKIYTISLAGICAHIFFIFFLIFLSATHVGT